MHSWPVLSNCSVLGGPSAQCLIDQAQSVEFQRQCTMLMRVYRPCLSAEFLLQGFDCLAFYAKHCKCCIASTRGLWTMLRDLQSFGCGYLHQKLNLKMVKVANAIRACAGCMPQHALHLLHVKVTCSDRLGLPCSAFGPTQAEVA